MIVLDEPEVNLHPEKQNDLVRLLREYHAGSSLIATHSVELMNNVSVSHIIHVQKKYPRPVVKATEDRASLEAIRSQIGSNFNLIASQFESCDRVVFTEETSDYKILCELASCLRKGTNSFNIPLHGFCEYRKGIAFKEAFGLLIGGHPQYSMLLDRDYYPDPYLERVDKDLGDNGIELTLTPGKEIENLFLSPEVQKIIVPPANWAEWTGVWDKLLKEQYHDCLGSLVTLHQKNVTPRVDVKTIMTSYAPAFEEQWSNPRKRHLLLNGKNALQRLRGYYHDKLGTNLTSSILNAAAIRGDRRGVEALLSAVLGI